MKAVPSKEIFIMMQPDLEAIINDYNWGKIQFPQENTEGKLEKWDDPVGFFSPTPFS